MKTITLTCHLLCISSFVFSQISKVNIPISTQSSKPEGFVIAAGKLFFTTNIPTFGRELWVTDGSAEGTKMVTDIGPGAASGLTSLRKHTKPAAFKNNLFFKADDGTNGTELWQSQGDPVTTSLLKDILPGGSSYPSNLTVSGETLFFLANDGAHGRELWKTDGTPSGTVMVKDIFVGSGSAFVDSLAQLTDVNGTLYFVASDGVSGYEVWKSDGTENGTTILKDVQASELNTVPANLFNFNGTLFFSATDPTLGTELWKSEGSEATTSIIADLMPGGNSSPSHFYTTDGLLYFAATTALNRRELWKTDGTAAGTTMVKVVAQGQSTAYLKNIIKFGSSFFFTAGDDIYSSNLYRMDPDNTVHRIALTEYVDGIGELVIFGNRLFVTVDDSTLGTMLYVIETPHSAAQRFTPYAIERLRYKNTKPYANGYSNLPRLIVYAENLYFPNIDQHGQELWTANGTNTRILKDLNTLQVNTSITQLVQADSQLYYKSEVNHLYEMNAETEVIRFIDVYDDLSTLKTAEEELFYRGHFNMDEHGNNQSHWLFKISKSLANPIPLDNELHEIVPAFIVSDTAIYYNTRQGGYSNDIKLYNKTTGKISLVAQYGCAPFSYRCPGISTNAIQYGNYFYYTQDYTFSMGTSTMTDSRIYRANGEVSDFFGVLSTSIGNRIRHLAVSNNTLFISGQGSSLGSELFKITGESSKIELVKDIRPDEWEGGSPEQLCDFNDRLFFSADDGIHGRELWVSNGTADGTVMLADLNQGPASSSPTQLTVTTRGLFFVASDALHGEELWITDGTPAGTRLVKDIVPGLASSFIENISHANGRIFFSALDESSGQELWKTDGTYDGTRMIADINPGSPGSGPSSFVHLDEKMYFVALDADGLRKLWRYDFQDEISTEPMLSLCRSEGILSFDVGKLFNENNIFTLEIDDVSNDFSSPIAIGTLSGRRGGAISYKIPAALPADRDYEIRVRSSSPESIVTNKSYDLQFEPAPLEITQMATDAGFELSTTEVYSGYEWMSGDSTISTDEVMLVTESGIYSVRVTDGTCTFASGPFTISVTATENEPSDLFELFPNPTQDELWVRLTDHSHAGSLSLYNAFGQVLVQTDVAAGTETIEVSIDGFPEGVYYLTFDNSKRRVVKKVIKKMNRAFR